MEEDVMSKSGTLKKPRRQVSEDYLELVSQLPIRPLKSDREHALAQRLLDRLVGRADLSPGQIDYVAGLARFVADYEREHRKSALGHLSPVEVVRHLMAENDMTTSELGDVLGSRGLASEVLNGKRGLSKMLIAKLAERFHVDPALFLDKLRRKTD
jgi:HTH-type transcriptional regulator/antitoxin HigA